MNDLVQVLDSQILVSSRQIAEHFEKLHDKVIRDIENAIDNIKKSQPPKLSIESMFQKSTYTTERGRTYLHYLMNRDGFCFIVMGFNNTPKVIEWKLKYIAAFNEMEKQLQQQKEQQAQVQTNRDLSPAEKAVQFAALIIQFDKDIRDIKKDITKLFSLIPSIPQNAPQLPQAEQTQMTPQEYVSSIVKQITQKYGSIGSVHRTALKTLQTRYGIDPTDIYKAECKISPARCSKFEAVMRNQTAAQKYIQILKDIALEHNVNLV